MLWVGGGGAFPGGEEEEEFSSLTNWDKQEISEAFYQRLQELRVKELERGVSLVGPHRDELSILKSGLLARSHASQGEAWSLAGGRLFRPNRSTE